MNQPEIVNTILYKLYEAKFGTDKGMANIFEICDEGGCDENTFMKVVDQLTNYGLIRARTIGGFYEITSEGTISAEEQSIAPEELARINRRARTLALNVLANVYEKVYEGEKGSLGIAHFEYLSEKTDISAKVLAHNLQVLEDLGHVESMATGYRITYFGLDAVEKWRRQVSIERDFERISEMEPQPRGREFQKLFARIVEQHGWSQDESVHTSHEELDVIIYQGREYYLVECKWEKRPTGADVIREFLGKLRNRAGIQGMVVSMSGFTGDAVKQVKDYVNDRVILLFGSEDVHSMVFGRVAFEELLNEKYKELVTRREVLFS